MKIKICPTLVKLSIKSITTLPILFAFTAPLYAVTIADQLKALSTQTLKEKVSNAITKFEQTDRASWAYQVARYENEEGDITSSIEQFTPAETIEMQWELIQLNGDIPSEKQKQTFTKQKIKQLKEKNKGTNVSVPLREIIHIESLTLISEDEQQATMEFNVHLKKLGDDAKDKLQGSLIYNKPLNFIENITIINNEEFTPVFSASISEFKLSFAFTQINQSIFPLRQDMKMKGTFAFFTEINEVSSDKYSGFNYQKPIKE